MKINGNSGKQRPTCCHSFGSIKISINCKRLSPIPG